MRGTKHASFCRLPPADTRQTSEESSKCRTCGDLQELRSRTHPHRERPTRRIPSDHGKRRGHSRRPQRKHPLPFKDLAEVFRGGLGGVVDPPHRALAIMQAWHSGRQSANWVSGRLPWNPPLAPTSIRVGARESGFIPHLFYRLLFSTPREMSIPIMPWSPILRCCYLYRKRIRQCP